jgi:hypothetical protein
VTADPAGQELTIGERHVWRTAAGPPGSSRSAWPRRAAGTSCSPAPAVTSTRSSRSCSAEQAPLPDRTEPRIRGDGCPAVTQGQTLAGRALSDPGRHAATQPVRPRRPAAPMAAQYLHRPLSGRAPGLRGAGMEEPGGHSPLRPLRRLALSRLGRDQQRVRVVDRIEAKQPGWRIEGCLPWHPILCRMALDHPDDPSGSF